jgi:hypothetical protein
MYYRPEIERLEIFEKKFSILQEISNIIVVTDNINAIANLMLDLAIDYTNAGKGSLMLVNEQGELYILAARGIDNQLVIDYRAKMGEGVAGIVARDLCPVRVEDIDQDERFKIGKRDRYKTKSFISCPIISKNKLLGVLNTNDKKDNSSFTDDDLSLITTIANQAAIALENALLVNQLKVKAAELEEMNSKLIETDVVKTEFLARISHELRTPLNSIKGSIYYLDQSEKLSRSEQKEFFGIISNEAGKLISAVEMQLDFLRLEDEAKSINKSVINILDVMNEVRNSKLLSTVLEKNNIKLFIDHKLNLSEIVGDKIRTVQLFINLIEGLTKFLLPGDTIKCVITENAFVKIQLVLPHKLPEAVLPHFFSSSHLFQSNPPDKKFKLYLAIKIVEIHGWNLTYENHTSGFHVSLTIPKNISG